MVPVARREAPSLPMAVPRTEPVPDAVKISSFAETALQNASIQLQDYSVCTSLDELATKIASGAPYDQNQGRVNLWGQGPVAPKLLVFSMAPSPFDFKEKQLFCHDEGQLLDNMLVKILGMQRSECFLSYVQKSLFSKRLLPRERNPLRLAFEQEIRLVQPRALLCLGADAAWTLLQNGSPLEQMQAQELHFAGVPMFVTFSLGEMIAEPGLRRNAMMCLNRVKSFLENE